MKRIISIILIISIVTALYPGKVLAAAVVNSGTCGDNDDNVIWTEYDDGLFTVSGTGRMKDYASYSWLPWMGPGHTGTTIKKVVINDGVTHIGNYAFGNTYALINCSEIVIAGSVTSIGDGAFAGCSAISEIALPSKIERIGAYAFRSCIGLESFVFPPQLKVLPEFMFQDCIGLKQIAVPSGFTALPRGFLSGCSGLTSVTIPDSITSIEMNAFSLCTSLSDVYYSGSENQWKAIRIESGNDCLLSATIHYLVADSSLDNVDTSVLIFNGHAYKFINEKMSWLAAKEYCEKLGGHLVTITSQEEQDVVQKLTASRGNAMIGLSDSESEGSWKWVTSEPYSFSNWAPGEPNNQSNENYVLMYSNGAWNDGHLDRESWSFICEWDDSSFLPGINPSVDITVPNTDKTINVTIATGMGDKNPTASLQWNDNWFESPATIYNHELSKAAMTLSAASYVNTSSASITEALAKLDFDNLKSAYIAPTIDNNDIVSYTFGTKKVYVDNTLYTLIAVIIKGTSSNEEWYSNFNIGTTDTHTGFALASNKLLKDFSSYMSGIDDGTTPVKVLVTGHSRGAAVANLVSAALSNENSVYGKYAENANVYGYTFATPRVSTKAQKDGYENIFNIVNEEDFVSRVPINNWNYKHYGIDLTLPSRSYSSNYDALYNKMNEMYKELTGSDYASYNGTSTVDNLTADVFTLAKDVNAFYNVKHDSGNPLTMHLDTMTTNDYFQVIARCLVNPGVSDYLDVLASIDGDYKSITGFFINNHVLPEKLNKPSKVFSAHSMAGYYSWISTCTARELFGSTNKYSFYNFKRVTIACPVNVFVYDENGNLVASVEDEIVTVDKLAINVEDGVKVVDLPADQAYDIQIIATDDGIVEYKVQEMRADGNDAIVTRTVSFDEIDINTDDTLSGQVNERSFTDVEDYDLTKNDFTTISATGDICETIPFIDVPDDSYYYDAVKWAVINNITKGTNEDGTIFSPDETCTRGQVVTFLWRANGSPEPTSSVNSFTDVKSSDYFYKAVLWAVENQITNGTNSDGTAFSPDEPCTRGQVVTFLNRAEGVPKAKSSVDPFVDVKKGAYYYDAVLWAVENSITNGTNADGTTFSPDEACTRGQIVTFLYRALGK